MKKIALVITWRYYPVHCDGGSLCMFEIVRWFRGEGFPVEIFAFVGEPPPPGSGEPYLDTVELRIGIRPKIVVTDSLAPGPVAKVLEAYGPDYVLTCDGDFVALAAAAALSIPGLHLFNSPDNIDLYEKNAVMKPLVRKRDVCVLSGFLGEKVRRVFGIDAMVWPPFFRKDLQRPDPRRPHTPLALGFYSAGRFKGDDIVRSLAPLAPEARILIVGGDYSYLRSPHPANVVCLGEVADMRGFYRDIDLLLVPSVWGEAFARVILEAAFEGVPALANRVGGIPEAIGDSGVLIDIDLVSYDPGDVAATYAEQVHRIIRDPALFSELSRKALERGDRYLQDQRRLQESFLGSRFPAPA